MNVLEKTVLNNLKKLGSSEEFVHELGFGKVAETVI